ncbi:hypothetical protein GCM10010172_02650 [Paractinoplanes ferrugineus]|uniref:Uncharacterized protein n=1 Tax=Paractinoplanes ferrugineus TaxID=113564 RepID=A0A919J4A9_9ACTN|nr:hypothetical protein [Actinoplanes ferrugineus]GIE13670.1 hypothetical protein Afe05nite_55100 [Actinoplanes ferrugineus]
MGWAGSFSHRALSLAERTAAPRNRQFAGAERLLCFGDQPFGRVRPAADGTISWDPVPSTVPAGPPRLLD